MAEYTLHFLDSGKPVGLAMQLECDDDRQAIAKAEGVPHVHRMELWRLNRRVWTFDAPDMLREAG